MRVVKALLISLIFTILLYNSYTISYGVPVSLEEVEASESYDDTEALAEETNSEDAQDSESDSEALLDETDTLDIDEALNLFNNFELIEQHKLVSLIKSDSIKSVATCGNRMFIVLNDGSEYEVKDVDDNVISYVKLHDYTIKEIKIVAPADEKESTVSKETEFNRFAISIFIITLIFIAICYRTSLIATFKNRRPAVIQNKQSEQNNEQGKIQKDSKKDIPVVKFSDVEGIDELKEDVFRLVDCLKHPEKYERLGARIPKGIILYGPPGTGKTLLAKAIAGEAGVPFLSAVGSDFIEKYVGVGAKRVRELYKKAKQCAPCIVFIDEVDAVAGKREAEDNSESNQTINALLAELDGFNSKNKIITICATNRLDILDSAFTRAGRFDLKLAVGLPDKKSRLKILQIHSKNKRLADGVRLEDIANKTAGFSGAELEALLNEAAILAAGKDKYCITKSEIEDAFFKIVMKGNKKKREEITKTTELIAWHEAGHTLATKLLTDDEVSSVTIIGSYSGAGGVTFRNPKDEELHSKKYLRNLISVMYAGRAAEEIFLGDADLITVGASQDIKQATSIIKQYLALYGMGNLGMIDLTQLKPNFSDIIEEASVLAKEIYENTKDILVENKVILRELAETLLDRETLDKNEIDRIVSKYLGGKEHGREYETINS